MEGAAMKDAVITSTVTLDRVMFHRSEIVDAVQPYFRRLAAQRRPDRDAYEIRSMIDGWGRTARVELRCPTTWWQHLKLALRTRWPRLFGRLAVRFEHAVAENGASVAGLAPVMSSHLVIPYAMPVARRQYTDDIEEPTDP